MATFYRCDRCRQEVTTLIRVGEVAPGFLQVVKPSTTADLCSRCRQLLKQWLQPISAEAAVAAIGKKKKR